MTAPLFIFAATVCRFLEDLRWPPDERLNEFLDNPAIRSASEMERTYVPIINQLLTGRNDIESNRLKREFHDILGVLILLAEPLSVKALAKLVNGSESTVRVRLESFRSVLSVSKNNNVPVQTLHLSFRDFLVNTKQDFRIEEPSMHAIITSHCIRVMDRDLKQNICGLQSYGTQRTDINRRALRQNVSSQLRYSCRYWVYHLERASPRCPANEVLRFLKSHFLHWLEVIGLIGLIADAVDVVSALKVRVEPDMNLELSEFLHNAKRFITQTAVMVNLAPLQIYCSGIAFVPVNSPIRRTLEGHLKRVNSVAFSGDGQVIASGSEDHTIRVWDVNSGLQIRILGGHSEDGRILASGSDDHTFRFWNIKTGLLIQALVAPGCVNLITYTAANPDMLASSSGSSITVWDMKTGSEVWTQKNSQDVSSLDFSPDGQRLVSAGRGQNKIWDVKTGREISIRREPSTSAGSLSERQLLVSGIHGWAFSVLDAQTGLEIKETTHSPHAIESLAILQERHIVAVGSRYNDIFLWDVSTGSEIRKLQGHSGSVLSLTFSADSQILASGADDCTIKLWDVETSLKVEKVNGHSCEVRSVVISTDGKMVASAGGKYIKLWDAKTGAELRTLQGHSHGIVSLAFCQDRGTLISGALDSTARIWDTKTGLERHTLDHAYMVCSVAISADGRIAASGSGTNTVKLWDTTIGSEIYTLEGPVPPCDDDEVSSIVRSIAFLLDGQMVAAAFEEGYIRLWDIKTGSEIRTLDCNHALLSCIASSADGQTLVSGSSEDITVWDVNTGSKIRQMGYGDLARWVALSKDGQMVVSGSNHNGINIWDIKNDWAAEGLSNSQERRGSKLPDHGGPRLDKI
ncbi:wd40 protein [Penicillium cf. viridicatum]|uniref:Wd40 protein n=1 Tax=Penicillium cf. viridicatum TaxID=2972119 RepID=A0A9W9MAV0_9EURO|nr:wd40 protein [Penicillium cf. viridicatum]